MAEGNTESESQKSPDILEVGQSFSLEKNMPTLLGRADCAVPGYKVYKIAGLEDNLKVSRFGVQMVFDGQKIVISRPEFSLDEKQYIGSNRITVTDNLYKHVEVSEKYDSGVGNSIYKIYIGDKEAKNGFLLMPAGNDMFRLDAITNKG
jgi:hypothetical protein